MTAVVKGRGSDPLNKPRGKVHDRLSCRSLGERADQRREAECLFCGQIQLLLVAGKTALDSKAPRKLHCECPTVTAVGSKALRPDMKGMLIG